MKLNFFKTKHVFLRNLIFADASSINQLATFFLVKVFFSEVMNKHIKQIHFNIFQTILTLAMPIGVLWIKNDIFV